MRFEFYLIVAMGILAAGIIALIASDMEEAPNTAYLEQINSKAMAAKEGGMQEDFASYKTMMQQALIRQASQDLGVKIGDIDLDAQSSFPFKNVSDVKMQGNSEKVPVCEIIPNIPYHMEQIRSTKMFSMFVSKYGKYQMDMDIMDERYFNSTVHYTLLARSGNHVASTWFHVNSCTGQIANIQMLGCRDLGSNSTISTTYAEEISASLESDEFCTIHMEPWRQDLYDYNQGIDKMFKEKVQSLKLSNPLGGDTMGKFVQDTDKLLSLEKIASLAMDGKLGNENLSQSIQKYQDKYGGIPPELAMLVDAAEPKTQEPDTNCLTIEQARQVSFAKVPTTFPQDYSIRCMVVNNPNEIIMLISDHPAASDDWKKESARPSGSNIFFHQVDESKSLSEPDYEQLGTAEQRIRATIEEINAQNPESDARYLVVNGIPAYGIEGCNGCGVQTADFGNDTVIKQTYDAPSKLKIISDDGTRYSFYGNVPLDYLVRMGDSLQ